MVHDRVTGVLLAGACADALGAGYEFGPPLPDGTPVSMIGGNGFAPGEWTDDTAMTVAVARAAVDHDLATAEGLDAVAAGFREWFHSGPNDVGIQTRAVLRAAPDSSAAALSRAAAAYFQERPDRSAGNGALMRTAPVALATLDADEATAVRCAIAVGGLTHADPVSGEACALWTLAVRYAVRHATFDGLRLGLNHLSNERAAYWQERLDEAERRTPADFERNGWVVEALQAAWCAVVTSTSLRDGIERAVRGGRDADTVATIAGALLGARWGASAIPPQWIDAVHGWPGYRAGDLRRLAETIRSGGTSSTAADQPH